MSSETVYLDYNATVPVRPEARDAILSVLDFEQVGNPSSIHSYGRKARSLVEKAREQIAALVGSNPQDVIFTGSGTEANNQALKAWPERRLFVSQIEHDSVRDIGVHRQTLLPVKADGRLDVSATYEILAAHDGPMLVALMAVNNETGIEQPVVELAQAIHSLKKSKKKDILLHCDAVQAAGKIHVDIKDWGVDTLSISGHKIGATAGIGALVCRSGLVLPRFIDGGGQERRLRAGTENIAGIAGFAAAAVSSADELYSGQLIQTLKGWRLQLVDTIRSVNPAAALLSENASYQIGTTINVALPGVRADTLVMKADLAGLAISAGSACSSGKVNQSAVALAMGFSPELAKGSVRLSIGWATTKADIDQSVQKLAKIMAP